MKVKCIQADGVKLTIGKIYETEPAVCGYYNIENDAGYIGQYIDKIFEIVEKKENMKFKKGDKVRCLKSESVYFTKGNIYTVAEDYKKDYNLSVEKDDEGNENGWAASNFENIVFKVGDLVEAVESIGDLITIGTTYEITGIKGDYVYVICDKGIEEDWYLPLRFKLLESKEPTNEELLELVIKGQEAREQLVLKNILEQQYSEGKWIESRHTGTMAYRLKKKSFEPFTIGKNWNVRFDNDKFMVGCQKFDIDDLFIDLNGLLNGNLSVGYTYKDLRACKSGVWHGIYNNISWEDAEKVYRALKEYLDVK